MKLLLTGAISWTDSQIKEIESLGHEVIYVQDERIPLEVQGVDVETIEGIVCNGLFLYNDISKFRHLKYIQLTSAGYDRIPLEYIQEHQIEIRNARGVYSIPMAEFALCGVLQIYKKSHFFYENQKIHKWEKNRELLELSGKQVCIIGCGSVGTECAKRFSVFECNIIGIDLHPRKDINYTYIYEVDKLEFVLSNSDIVILTLPLTDATRHLINKEKINAMKSGAILVNIGRGGLLDLNLLKKKLPEMRGVVLDVFEDEPLDENDELWEIENVIITPHNSFVGDGNRGRLRKIIVDNLQNFKR